LADARADVPSFGRTQPVIARHIANVFKEGELEKEVVYAKIAYTTRHGAIAGKTQIKGGMNYLVKQLSEPSDTSPPNRFQRRWRAVGQAVWKGARLVGVGETSCNCFCK
jgi:hypothetical protein